MKKKLIIGSIIFFILLIIILFINRPIPVNKIKLGNERIEIKIGDKININKKGKHEVIYNLIEHNKKVKIHGNITIGSPAQKVEKKFKLNDNTATLYVEVPNKKDDIFKSLIVQPYNEEFFKNNKFINTTIILGYKLENKKWITLNNQELTNPKKGYLIYKITVDGKKNNTVSKIEITYFNKDK